MIVQHNPASPNADVTIDPQNPALIRIAAHTLPNGVNVPATVFDLGPHQGGPVRIYVEEDGSLQNSVEGVHYWLIAEAVLPQARMEQRATGQTDEHGQPIVEMAAVPLDLNMVDIVVYPWPE